MNFNRDILSQKHACCYIVSCGVSQMRKNTGASVIFIVIVVIAFLLAVAILLRCIHPQILFRC